MKLTVRKAAALFIATIAFPLALCSCSTSSETSEPAEEPSAAQEITIDVANQALKKGDTTTIEVTPAEEASNVVYQSSNENVATVDDQGVVTAVKAGSATISAMAPDSDEVLASVQVTVEGATQAGTVTTSVDMSQYDKGSVVRAWIPVAQSNEYQVIDDVAYEADGATRAEITEDTYGNQMLYVEWDASVEPASRVASCSFFVEREEAACPELVEEGTVGSDMEEYLGASSMVSVTGEVKDLADEITKDETTYLGKARAIYDWVIANMNRDNDVKGCGQGDVCALLDTKAGKCTDINSMFVALCRASGVPAREMFGVRINDEDITKNQHCWAEFYLPGTGWIPADPADVLKAVLTNEWDKSSNETKEMQEYYWGNWDEKRVELSRGRDLTLNPAQDGDPLNTFGYPYAEVDGEAVDYYTPDAFVYSIAFAEKA